MRSNRSTSKDFHLRRRTDFLTGYRKQKGCIACGERDPQKLAIFDKGSLVRVPLARYKAMDFSILRNDLAQNAVVMCPACAKAVKAA